MKFRRGVPVAPVVVSTPGIMSGEPCIQGTRVPAATVLAEIEAARTEAEIRDDYPVLPAGVVEAVLEWSRTRS